MLLFIAPNDQQISPITLPQFVQQYQQPQECQ